MHILFNNIALHLLFLYHQLTNKIQTLLGDLHIETEFMENNYDWCRNYSNQINPQQNQLLGE